MWMPLGSMIVNKKIKEKEKKSVSDAETIRRELATVNRSDNVGARLCDGTSVERE